MAVTPTCSEAREYFLILLLIFGLFRFSAKNLCFSSPIFHYRDGLGPKWFRPWRLSG